MAVFVKDAAHAADHPRRIIPSFTEFTNGRLAGTEEILNHQVWPEDQMALSTRVRRRWNRFRGRQLG